MNIHTSSDRKERLRRRYATRVVVSMLAAILLFPSCDLSNCLKTDVGANPYYDDGVLVDRTGHLVITQFGISWMFDTEYEYGQFANGDYWIIGPVTLLSIFPVSREISGRTKNGSMINPTPENETDQGYDSSCYATKYVPELNAALNISPWNPLVVQNGTSLVSSKSVTEPESRPQLQSAAVLTVLAEPPATGSFRPPYCGDDKTISYNVSMLDATRGLLGMLEPVDETPTLSDVERYFERPWIDHVPGWSGGYIHPLDNMQNYGRDLTAEMSIGALMLHLNLSDEEKETLLVRFIQLGIDLYGVLQNGGSDNWHNDGGHASGRKWPILFAGIMLNDDGMKSVGQKSGDYLYAGGYGPGNIPPDYIHFGEDDQTFYVTAEDVALGSTVSVDPNHCTGTFYGHYYPSDCIEYPEYTDADIGMPEWGIVHSSGPLYDGNIWTANYRDCCTAISWCGFILAARIMDANTPELWNHPALFDYHDRYMHVTAPDGEHPGWRTSDSFTEKMWDQYRSLY